MIWKRRMNKKFSILHEEHDSLKKEYGYLKQKHDALEQNYETLEDRWSNIISEIAKIKLSKNQSDALIGSLRTYISKLQKKLKSLGYSKEQLEMDNL